MKFKELNIFHDKILGRTPKDRRYRATPRQKKLYRGYVNEDRRGFACMERDEELFIATLVLALRQVQFKGETDLHPVILAVPKALDAWAFSVSKDFYRAVLKRFRGDVTMAHLMRKAFEKLLWEHRVLQIPEPPRWVAYGFDYTFPVPSWMEGRFVVCPR
jgi:hypothetical protein